TDEQESIGNRDVFLSKFSNDMFTYYWTNTFGGENVDIGRGVATDSSGNVYLTGDFENSVNFDPTDENNIHTALGFSDVFLTQFNNDGDYGWTASFGGEQGDHSYDIALNSLRNTYLAGSFTDTADFDPTDQNDFYTSKGDADIFISNYDTNRPPTIEEMIGAPNPVNRGDNLTLSTLGTNDIDGGVNKVLFYYDSDSDSHLNTENDLLLGNGFQQNPQTWSWIGSSGMFPIGNNTFFAQAWDKNQASSEPVNVTLRINDIPIIASLTDNPDPVIQGNLLTLSANNVSDFEGPVVQVEFYRDADYNGILQVNSDEYLGAGTNNAANWSWTGSTAAFPTTLNRYFARAQDNDGAWGIIANTVGKVNVLPTIGSLSDSPEPVTIGNNLLLTANNVADANGFVNIVEFYRDANNNGVLDAAIDDLLGVDANNADGWSWNGSTTGFDIGINQYFARAQDDDLAWSNTESTSGRVNDQPTISFLNDNPDPVVQGFNLMLTANNVQDSDGSITRVEFYRDTNNNGNLDFGVDSLL
ncbi:MAG: hypothetical protein GY869_32665, partial [Planctomycetes bacterium]|nr:hypothetical protein [Planctomycetota bacterium]